MVVDKPQPVSPPVFQPRLNPKPALPDGFRRALADQLDARPGTGQETAPASSGHPPPIVRLETGAIGHQVRGAIDPSASQGGDAARGEVASAMSNVPSPPARADGVRGTVVWPGASRSPSIIQPPTPLAPPAPESGAEPVAQAANGSAPPAPAASFSQQDEAALLAWAQAVKTMSRPRKPARAEPKALPPRSRGQALMAAAPDALAATAEAQLGRRYTQGGQSPRQGFDCSGLTSYVYGRSGIDLLRSSREQFRQGTPVRREDLRAGDLVFFGRKGVHHVGIYMGDGSFLHATAGGRVKTDSLDTPHWAREFAGARRIVGSDAGLSLGGASSTAG